jgi:vancomycin permeability regulator SanA
VTDEEISVLLFVREVPIRADLAMVFAAATEEDLIRRTRQGIRLYQDGYVPKLLVTGGGTLALTHPEAVRMGDLARQSGVAEADLLVESRSSNTFANARYSLELIRERGLLDRLSSVILVSSEWHMRRVLLTMEATFPPGLRLVCCPTLEGCARETWASSEVCRAEVLQELSIFLTFREAGVI